jgi:hypothetical protein
LVSGAHDERHQANRKLCVWQENRGARFAVERPELDVADDADDFPVGAARRSDADVQAHADRIASAEIPVDERLAHDSNAR